MTGDSCGPNNVPDNGSPLTDTPTGSVRLAIQEAGIGQEDLFADIWEIDGIGGVTVRDDIAEVVVTLPVPSSEVRERIERGLTDASTSVSGVNQVEVRWEPEPVDFGERVELLPEVKNVVAVASGKGGVGKSTVAVNLATTLADAGAKVGLLDADVYGPNAPRMLGLSDRPPEANANDDMVPRVVHGVKVMSMGFIAAEDDPVIWRGVLVDEFLKQLFGDVDWGPLDYLVVDLPPGTGDAQLSLVQHLPVAGVVIVTTPPAVAVDDAARGLTGFARYDVPVLGVVENMAWFRCPDCGSIHEPFGAGGGEELANEFGVPVLGRLPLDPTIGEFRSEDATDSRGISVPLVGRLQLPRTRTEREKAGRKPPIAIRTGGGAAEAEARRVFRQTATRTAARINEAAIWRSGHDG